MIGLVSLALVLASQTSDPGRWAVLERLPWGTSSRTSDRILIEQNTTLDNSPRLRLLRRGHPAMAIEPEGGLVKLSDGLQWAHATPPNRLTSDWVYAPSLSAKAGQNLFIVFGHAFASDPGSIRVVRIQSSGQPEVVYSDQTFQLETLKVSGSEVRLIGRRSLTQMSDRCLGTYDPFSVLRIRPNGAANYSPSLSRTYNLTHGYVWAGPHYREDIQVNVCSTPARVVHQTAR